MNPTPSESWMDRKWRPLMAIQYTAVCVCDFIIFPILFTIVQFWETSEVNDAFRQWVPITIHGGGLYHIAMGAVLGITAWSRGKEKIAGVAGPMQGNADYYQSHNLRRGYGGRLAPPPGEHPPL